MRIKLSTWPWIMKSSVVLEIALLRNEKPFPVSMGFAASDFGISCLTFLLILTSLIITSILINGCLGALFCHWHYGLLIIQKQFHHFLCFPWFKNPVIYLLPLFTFQFTVIILLFLFTYTISFTHSIYTNHWLSLKWN